ncbi:MAG: double zinc ribbon domain-containing protein [Candidatus Helarchaeota archaeon]
MTRKNSYCEVCKKEFLTKAEFCPICNTKFRKSRKYCKNCEQDILTDGDICPNCGEKVYNFKKIKFRAKCADCLEEFCIKQLEVCPSCKSKKLIEIECPCVFYPTECVKLIL